MTVSQRITGEYKQFRTQRVLVGELEGDVSDASVKATGASAFRTLGDLAAESVFAADVVADGQDKAAAIQAAVDFAEANNVGLIDLPNNPDGVPIKVASTITVNKPIVIRGRGCGTASASTNHNSGGNTEIQWTGGASPIFHFIGPSAQYLHGGGIQDISIDGANAATVAVRMSSTVGCRAERLFIQRCTTHGVLVDGGNSLLAQHNVIDTVHGVATTTEAAGMNLVSLVGSAGAGAVTQTLVRRLKGRLTDGHFLYTERTDNNQVFGVHASHGGTGKAVYFGDGGAAGLASTNNFVDYVVGDIHSNAYCYGNSVKNWISEAASFTIDSGGHMHVEAFDYNTSGRFQTKPYWWSERLAIPGHALRAMNSNAVAAIVAEQWPGFNLSAEFDAWVGAVVPPPDGWARGYITGVCIWYTVDTVSLGDCTWRIRLDTTASGTSIASPDADENFTHDTVAVINVLDKQDLIFATPVAYNRGEWVGVTAVLTDVAGATSGNIQVVGMELIYESDGPTGGGSGPYAVPPRHRPSNPQD